MYILSGQSAQALPWLLALFPTPTLDNDVCWLSRRRSQPRGVWRAEKDAKGEIWGTARLPFATQLRSCLPVDFQPVLDVEKPACLVGPTRRVMMSPDGVRDISLLSIMEPERHRCSAQGQGIACRTAEKRIPSTFSTRL